MEYPNYGPLRGDDDITVEDQPLPTDASPTALSPGYVADSDLEEDPIDYATNADDDEEDEDSSEDMMMRKRSTWILLTLLLLLLQLLIMIRLRAASLLPLLAPSTSRRADILEAYIPPQKRLCLTAPTPRFEVGESSAARQPGSIMARRVDYSFIDTVDASIQAYERRTMVAIEGDHVALRDEVYTLRRHWRLEHVLILSRTLKMPPKKRTATTTTTTTPMTDAQHKSLIAQGDADALAEIKANITSRNGDDSHDSGTGSRRTERPTREYTYSNFLKCQPLNFKGTKRVVGLTQWFEKMESVFYISNCTITCQINTVQEELSLMCSRMFFEESDEIEKYVSGLPDMIHGSVMASKPKTMQDAIEFATELMDQKIRTLAYTAGPGEKKPYRGSKPLCPKCNYHHDRQCAPKGHFKSNCPKLKNKNYKNQAGNCNVVARAYGMGTAETNPNFNVVMGMFLLNNHYGLILFDSGTDRSFVSSAFSSLIDIILTTLDHGYDVKLADGRIIWVNTLIRGCTLDFLNHPFNIDLMPVEMDSFDIIIGMDWLSKYHVVIVCDEKIIRIPFGNEILIVRGNGSSNEHVSISCTKTQKYLLKGCHVFLAHVTAKKAEDKSNKK
nr:hypothetical protein [Tanacetum cinerariifolium]